MICAEPVPPWAVKFKGAALAVAVHVDPDCVTTTVLLAMVRVAVRCEKLFGATKTVTDPLPVPLAVGRTQGELAMAVQEQNAGRTSDKFRIPPLESNVSDEGVNKGSMQDPGS